MREEHKNPIPFIRELCAHKTEEEILEAEETFRDYLRVVRKTAKMNAYKQNEDELQS